MKRRKIAHQQVSFNNPIFRSIYYEKINGVRPDKIISVCPSNNEQLAIKHDIRFQGDVSTYWLWVGNQYPSYPSDFSPPHDIESQQWGGWDGYSNHVHGIAAPLWAVAHGAKIIECHVTLDPTEESIKDNHFALTPEQFETMVKVGNQISMLGEKND